jgi:hypothetical protein
MLLRLYQQYLSKTQPLFFSIKTMSVSMLVKRIQVCGIDVLDMKTLKKIVLDLWNLVLSALLH